MKTHLYIAIEGAHGSGKSTLSIALENKLKETGYKITRTHEPRGTQLGTEIQKLVNTGNLHPETEQLLFLAARAELHATVIKPWLKNKGNKNILIADRCLISTLAYQGFSQKQNVTNILKAHKQGLQALWPDLCVILLPEEQLRKTRLNARTGDTGTALELKVDKEIGSAYKKSAIAANKFCKKHKIKSVTNKTPQCITLTITGNETTEQLIKQIVKHF
jgi:dTMP kinase